MGSPAASVTVLLIVLLTQPTTVDTQSVKSLALTTATPTLQPWDKYRLPDTLSPVQYNVTLWPRLTTNAQGLYIFTGHSTMDFECVKETDLILVHSNKLNYTTPGGHHATLTGLNGAVAPTIKTSWLQERTQYLVIQLYGKLVPGESYRLYTRFQGELAEDLNGFYRSHYSKGVESKYLEYTLDPTKVRKQDATSTIGYIANNVIGQSFAWGFFRSNWNYIFKEFGSGSFALSSLISAVTTRFSTEYELQQLLDFKRDNPDLGSGKAALDQAIEKTTANIKWMAENKKPLLAWFKTESAS